MSNQTPLTPKEFADKIRKSLRTVQRWDEKGVLLARRNPMGDPFYMQADVDRYLMGWDRESTPANGQLALAGE